MQEDFHFPQSCAVDSIFLLFFLVVSVQDVDPNSPAAIAGLRAHTDFIVGADQVLQDVSIKYYLLIVLNYNHNHN